MPEPMDAARWTAVQTLFEAALDRTPAERDAFLRAACINTDGEIDADLYAEVASLVNVEVHSLLQGLAVDAVDLPAMLSMEDERVGPYRIVRELGRGGMGIVYLAERDDGAYEQAVALKLVKRGMDSESIVRRFEQERQILARLAHSGIARLLDGGLADDGRPYFAMEVVEGEPITAYCDARALGVEARLALFERVCDAVAYAHTRLIVHRDLKPSNILVIDGEAGPEVKLLDFGIARLLEHDGPGLTWSGLRPMTPEYAAPEQVRGEPVTTAADVYALGTLLYELLAGRRPHALDRKKPRDLEEAILSAEPSRPSLAVRQAVTLDAEDGPRAVTPEGVAHTRATTPERLTRRLAGDLDTITLKALAKEPDARYSSAEALADDIGRYRRGIPVEARRATAGYRVRKFVMRHRVGVATTAGVVAVLAAVIGFYTLRLAAERDRAQLEADKATEVSAFLTGLFSLSDPAESRGAEITARQLLAEGAERIENELATQPEVQAQMYGTLGRVYQSLGLSNDAERLLQRSLALHERLDTDPLATARAQTALGDLAIDQGNYDVADSLLQRSLAAQRAGYDGPHEDLARTLQVQAALLQESGQWAAAEAPLLDALAMLRTLHDGDYDATADLLNSLGLTYFDLGRYDDSERYYAEALAMRRRLHGDLHPDVTQSLRQFSALQRRQRNYGEAEGLIREAIALDSQLVGLQHPTIGEDYYEYASLLKSTGRFEEATRVFNRTLAVDSVTIGGDHPFHALAIGELGMVRLAAGDAEGAVFYLRKALDLQRRVLPPNHPEIAAMLNKLGQALPRIGALEEGEQAIREALAIQRVSLDEDHPAVLSTRSALASLLSSVDRDDEAIALHRDILVRRQRTQGNDSPDAARSTYNLAAALRAKGTPEALAEARTVIADAVTRYRAIFPAESREMGYVLMEQADVLRASGETEEAATTYREADRVFRAALGDDHPILGRIERSLADMESS